MMPAVAVVAGRFKLLLIVIVPPDRLPNVPPNVPTKLLPALANVLTPLKTLPLLKACSDLKVQIIADCYCAARQTSECPTECADEVIARIGERVDAIENIAAVESLVCVAWRGRNRQRRARGILAARILNREAHYRAAGNCGGNDRV